ncbi:MAG: hypothetical protein P4L51_07870 [Puia sp.]|nr:hypothetical protein [Puia sp.]
MKKIFLSSFFFLPFATLHAQSDTPAQPVKTGNEWRLPADVFKRSRIFSDSLQKSLGLDATQTKKVYEAYLANTKSVDEILMLPVSADEKKEKMKANHDAFNATLKGIFTPAQFGKYIRLDAARAGKTKAAGN